MANAASVNSIAQLQTAATFPGAVAFVTEPGRAGAFVWRAGNFVAQVAADPLKGLHVPSSTTMPSIGCWVREWDGAEGRPEWFGAVPDDPAADNRAALRACLALCPVTALAGRDYYVRDTLVVTFPGSRGGAGESLAATLPGLVHLLETGRSGGRHPGGYGEGH